ncbi:MULTISPECIES: helix-turn-helix domain-containing protein [unclassified Arthrobacter]|uniref:helix-turn-helix domain-containing protein n=1 Tax=unclassified Arthrobacter TaxID=235627 RepID=UPI003FA3724D
MVDRHGGAFLTVWLGPPQPESRRVASAGRRGQKTGLAREFGISRETLYQYLRTDSPAQ